MAFKPLFTTFRDAEASARDLRKYNLTAIVEAADLPAELLFRLEAVLSFIEHLDVIVTEPEPLTTADGFSQFPKVLFTAQRNNGGGAIIGSDTFFGNSRQKFVEQAVLRLGDSAYCEATGYRTLFLKTTETFRQRRPFLEVSYFLLFSGLETYVRKTLNDFTTREVALLLNRRLRAMGFNVFHFSPTQPERSMDTYARLRNALFHNSEFEATRNVAGSIQTYKLTSYYAHFLILLALVVLKATNFDDGHTNWDAWIDQQLHK